MTQAELVAMVAEASDLSKAVATKAVNEMLKCIVDALGRGDEVRLAGFGTFYVTERAARDGRNPRTGEPLHIAASRQPKFKPGKPLRDTLNESATS